jgi:hypothetical protein
MRNELNRLVQTVSDPNTKRVCLVAAYMLVSHRPRGQGVRHGDAVLLLPLYALSLREGQEPRPVCNPYLFKMIATILILGLANGIVSSHPLPTRSSLMTSCLK